MLFIPGNNPAMLQNADVFESDAIIIDLEDAVSPFEKDAARQLVKAYLSSVKEQFAKIYIRINGLDTAWYQADLEAVVSDKITGIMVPKADVMVVKNLSSLLFSLETEKRMKKTMEIFPIIESAKAVLEIEGIADLCRVEGLLLGAEDLTSDMEIDRTKKGEELAYPRAKIAFACKAWKIDAVDTPFTDTQDSEGLLADCRTAQNLGLNGKAAIHPNQLPAIHDIFSPSEKRIEWALRVVASAKKAQEQGLGVFSLDGKMVDKPIIERAEKILTSAKKFNLLKAEND
jgi:citrate lyase subunit beta/citryl-CoA lyase